MEDSPDAPWGTVETRFDPIHSAARERDLAAVFEQLASGVPVDLLNGVARNGDGGNTALWFACQGAWPGGLAIVKCLVDAGARINRVCEHGSTALHMAARYGHHEVVRYLVEHGADVTARSVLGQSPAGFARDNGHHDIAAYLDELG
ncbi:MAG: ankyrin repeat domain-containing protein [Proteobacteria bacterium]|nr:ankyrin repeat domain-containing protein [Pseudomonadota bacterium]